MGWSFKRDRRLIEIARATDHLETAARLTGLPATSIKKAFRRLGISFKSRPSSKLNPKSKPRIKKQ
jgi:hypothetical protein